MLNAKSCPPTLNVTSWTSPPPPPPPPPPPLPLPLPVVIRYDLPARPGRESARGPPPPAPPHRPPKAASGRAAPATAARARRHRHHRLRTPPGDRRLRARRGQPYGRRPPRRRVLRCPSGRPPDGSAARGARAAASDRASPEACGEC